MRGRDGVYLGDADDAVRALVRAIGWEKELDALVKNGRARLEKEWKAMEALGRAEVVLEAEEAVLAAQEKEAKGEEKEAGEEKTEVERKEEQKKPETSTTSAEPKELNEAARKIEEETAKDKAVEDEVGALTAGLASVKVEDKDKTRSKV